ncbi:sigma factor-like helix-turn-helix DNA-binding protein [Nocardia sp. NPDC051832]|uniref:RNA polymerase sigma factor n=1 Tax=Nocardia sp. NPDC051832 TaxID=3155673 RepID=UPI00341BCC9E
MPKYLHADGTLSSAGQALAAELYNPAVGAITNWLKGGTASAMIRFGSKDPLVLECARTDYELREEIAVETFCEALMPFLRQLDRGGYDATRGASISSFFIGACRNRLGGTVGKHSERLRGKRAQDREIPLEYLREDECLDPRQAADRFDRVEDVRLARRVLLKAPHDLRAALLLQVAEGTTMAAASRRIGVPPATIRSQLKRLRKKLAHQHLVGLIVIPDDTALGDWVRHDAHDEPEPAQPAEPEEPDELNAFDEFDFFGEFDDLD